MYNTFNIQKNISLVDRRWSGKRGSRSFKRVCISDAGVSAFDVTFTKV